MSWVTEQRFPPELLTQSDAERYDYFKKKRINHELMDRVKRELLNAIATAEVDCLIFVYGPTGVGKSTLADIVVEDLIHVRLEELKQDLEWIPAVHAELSAPTGGIFSWAEGFRELLIAMKEPLIDFKFAPRSYISGIEIPGHDRSNARRYQHAYEKAMSHRRPIIVLIDEAQYLGKVPAQRLTNQLDVVKCLAVRTGTPHGMLGTFDLLPLRNLNGQISRRSVDVYFPRYTNSTEDLGCFNDALFTFQANLPVKRCQDLTPYLDELLVGSAGCVGNLKKWLNRSLRLALERGVDKLTIDDVRNRALSKDQLAKLFAETVEGEERLQPDEGRYNALQRRLWPPTEANAQPDKKLDNKKRNSAPGRRRPTRDKIGAARMPGGAA